MIYFDLKIASVVFIFILTVISGFYPLFKRYRQRNIHFPVGEALSSGVFLGAGLIHMLAESSNGYNELGYHYPFAFLLAGISFLLLLMLEHFSLKKRSGKDWHQSNSVPIIAVILLSVHSFLAGAALGIAESVGSFAIIFFAIAAHKWAESLALAVRISKSGISAQFSIVLYLIFSLMTPIGILVGAQVLAHVSANSTLVPTFNALAAGTFLYIGTLHGIKRDIVTDHCCSVSEFFYVVVGFTLMAVVAVWL